jgi:hypothetical protein
VSILVTLMMEAICSTEMSVLIRATRCHIIPEDNVLLTIPVASGQDLKPLRPEYEMGGLATALLCLMYIRIRLCSSRVDGSLKNVTASCPSVFSTLSFLHATFHLLLS